MVHRLAASRFQDDIRLAVRHPNSYRKFRVGTIVLRL
jgi:hypothetical protein